MGRRPTYRLALLFLVGSLLVPAAAGAQSPAAHPHASARTERIALKAADAYWQQRGLTACSAPRIEYARLALHASGDAFIGPDLPAAYCVIRVSTELSWRGRAGAIDFCWTIVHERGHQAGRPHTATGIMREDGGGRPPAICARLLGRQAAG
jgi:hypothetical protein